MNDDLHIIFPDSECPPYSQLEDYFLRKLPEDEVHRIEQHLVDCEMCSDALDGLSKMRDPADLDRFAREINAGIARDKTKILGMTRNVALMAAAAVLLLLIGTGVVVQVLTHTEPNKQVSVNTAPMVKLPEVAAESGSPQPVQKEKAAKRSKELRSTELASPAPASVTAGEAAVETKELGADAVVPVEAVAEEVEVGFASNSPEYSVPPADSLNSSSESAVFTIAAQKTEDAKVARMSKESNILGSIRKGDRISIMEIGMKEFHAGNYQQAAVFFEQVAKNQPDNAKASYYLAYSYYKLKEPKKAEKVLKGLLSDVGNEYYERARALSDSLK